MSRGSRTVRAILFIRLVPLAGRLRCVGSACSVALLCQGAGLGAVAIVALAAAPMAPALDTERLEWRRLAAGAHGEAVTALALDPQGETLAVGDARGLRLVGRVGGDWRRVLHRGPVHDVAFLPTGFLEQPGRPAPGSPGAAPSSPAQGVLLVATEVGLYRVGGDGRADLLTPAPGASGRVTHRIAVSPVAVAVATEAGAFLSLDARHWQRPAPQLPFGPTTSVALREHGGGLECLAVVEQRLWHVRLVRSGERWIAERVVRETLPLAPEGEGPVDLVFGVGGVEAVVVLPTALATRDGPGEPWRVLRPALPPGARAQRLLSARGRLWLATDRGLLASSRLAGPWQRVAAPAGSADVRALASDAGDLYAAADDRVLVVRADAEPAPPTAPSVPATAASAGFWRLRTPEGDPPIEHVQRAVLAYLDLRPERMRALGRGVAHRGWWPVVSLRLLRARDEDRGADHDEAFVSGELRHTVDRDSSTASDFEASLTFSWDLGDIAYHPEQIDVSREAREVVKLRDDVLDEVTQLYFERRRVLAELAAHPDAPPAESFRLRLRAAELAAGIDAWTGGWFGRVRAGVHP